MRWPFIQRARANSDTKEESATSLKFPVRRVPTLSLQEFRSEILESEYVHFMKAFCTTTVKLTVGIACVELQ